MKRLLIASCLALGFSLSLGCASINGQMAAWVGHHQSELIESWGPPQQTAPNGAGGVILIYLTYRDLGQTPGQVYQNGTYTAPRQNGYTAQRMFYVNQDGIIYSYRWQGL